MDFRLRVFVEVATHLSFTKAATVLEISQPAISKHIQELEATFNVKLFERSAGRISLTSAGQVLLHHAEQVLVKYRELADDMELVASLCGEDELADMPEKIRIATTASSLQNIVAPMLEEFSESYPNVEIVLTVTSAEAVVDLFGAGEADSGFVETRFLHRRENLPFVLFVKQWYRKSGRRD